MQPIWKIFATYLANLLEESFNHKTSNIANYPMKKYLFVMTLTILSKSCHSANIMLKGDFTLQELFFVSLSIITSYYSGELGLLLNFEEE